MNLIAQVFLKLLTPKDVFKCMKGLVSENPFGSQRVNQCHFYNVMIWWNDVET